MAFPPTNYGYFSRSSEIIILGDFTKFSIQFLDAWSVADSGQVVQDGQNLIHQNVHKKIYFSVLTQVVPSGNAESDDVALGYLVEPIN